MTSLLERIGFGPDDDPDDKDWDALRNYLDNADFRTEEEKNNPSEEWDDEEFTKEIRKMQE